LFLNLKYTVKICSPRNGHETWKSKEKEKIAVVPAETQKQQPDKMSFMVLVPKK
jgi:hypothetical protein